MKVIYFDTETTGIRDSEICQLSYIIDNGVEIYGKNFFFKVKEMNPSAQAVHGFSIEMLEELSGGRTFESDIDEIEQDFSDAALIVAHNASFDISMMKKEFSRYGREFCVNNYLCTMRFMSPFMKLKKAAGGGNKYPRLSEVVGYYIQDTSIIDSYVQDFFNVSVFYHDARYDTVSLFLAIRNARSEISELMEKVCSSN